MKKPERMQLLGDFVRARRQQLLSPNDSGRVRRTPGLRREELAVKAGISVTWCAWIEQGRSAGISAKALSRLARALELSEDERATFFELSGKPDPEKTLIPSFATAPEALIKLVAAIGNPAYALDSTWSAACWNTSATELFPGWLGEDCDRNLLRYVFLNREARGVSLQWQEWAGQLVDQFRQDVAGRLEDPVLRDLIYSLSRDSSAFSGLWDGEQNNVADVGFRTFTTEEGRMVDYLQTRWNPPEHAGYTVIIHTPVAMPTAGSRRVPRRAAR